jgi:glutathione S-transferase
MSDASAAGRNVQSAELELLVLSLRYSSWSMRPWLALRHAGIPFVTRTVAIPELPCQVNTSNGPAPQAMNLEERRHLGSVSGLFPVLRVGDVSLHESLAIVEWAAERNPAARLWPEEWSARALARAICAEMTSGFGAVRGTMSCHLFGEVNGFTPTTDVTRQLERLFEIWESCLQRSGGPYLFGHFSNADCMYFPMFTRLLTYGIPLRPTAHRYGAALLANPAVADLIELARSAPAIPAYDRYLESLGGNPTGRIGQPFILPPP